MQDEFFFYLNIYIREIINPGSFFFLFEYMNYFFIFKYLHS